MVRMREIAVAMGDNVYTVAAIVAARPVALTIVICAAVLVARSWTIFAALVVAVAVLGICVFVAAAVVAVAAALVFVVVVVVAAAAITGDGAG